MIAPLSSAGLTRARSGLAGPVPLFLAIAVQLLLAGLQLVQPALLLSGSINDIGIPLDLGLRFRLGIIPSLDYWSPIGILYPALVAAGYAILGESARALTMANAILAVLACGLALIASRGQESWFRALLILAAGSVALTPTRLDGPWDAYHHLGHYNRWCWALMAAPVAWILAPTPPDRRAGLATGTSFALILALKLSMAAGIALPMGLAWLLRCRRHGLALAWPVALPVVLLLMVAAATGYAQAYARDLQEAMAIHAVAGGPRLVHLILCLGPFRPEASVLFVATWSSALFLARQGWRSLLLGFGLWAGCAVAALQNNDWALIWPGLGFALLLLRHGPRNRSEAMLLWLVAALGLAHALFVPVRTARAILQEPGFRSQAQPLGPAGSILADIHYGPSSRGDPHYAAIVEDRQALARMLAEAGGGRVVTLSFGNYGAMLGPTLRPAPHPHAWWHEGRTFTRDLYPPPERLFEGADLVVAYEPPYTLTELYLPWLEQHATLIGTVAQHRLYRLTPP